MINSRDLSLLRDDVERNVRTLIDVCAADGLPVLITQTVRDNEYQASLYAQGRTAPGNIVTNSRTTTFHGAGLAVDFCKNSRSGAYSDSAFFDRVIAIAKTIGFSSGRDWKSFPESCHLQWDNHGKNKNHNSVPLMPEFEEDNMTQEKFDKMMDDYLERRAAREVSPSSKLYPEYMEAIDLGITDGSSPYSFATKLQVAVMDVRGKKMSK